jgi:hypothetical protein
LHPDLRDDLPAICAHYDRIGLSYTEQIIWNLDYAEYRHYPHYETSYFFFGTEQHRVAGKENFYRVVDYINSKNNFIDLAQQLGMKPPPTQCFAGIEEVATKDLQTIDYPCYLKAAVSVSGVGIYRCESETELRQWLGEFDSDLPVQIQQEVKTETFLNLQYLVSGSRLERLAATEQLLQGYAHQGNRFPTPHNAWFSVEPMAKWLFSQGMRGIFAFDVAVVKDRCGIDYLPIECNPRFNGASYPTLIAKKLGIQRWQTRTYATRYRSIAELPIAGLEYNPADQSGIVLVNWGSVRVGKLLVLIAGTPVQQQALREKLEQHL